MAQALPEPLVLACGDVTHSPDLVPEVRAAASMAVTTQIVDALQAEFKPLLDLFDQSIPVIRVKPIPLGKLNEFERAITERISKLERIAQGPNAQCRAAGGELLDLYFFHAFVEALISLGDPVIDPMKIRNEFPSKEFLHQIKLVTDSVVKAQTFELGLTRAGLTFLPFLTLAVADMSANISSELFDSQKWERIACGAKEPFATLGIELDGSLFIRNNDSQGFPFRAWAASSWPLSILLGNPFGFSDPTLLPRLLDKALHGCNPELRASAAIVYLILSQFISPNDEAALRALAREGGSTELRAAAAGLLAPLFAKDKALGDQDLQRLAFIDETAELKSAAGLALGLRWEEQAKEGKLGLATALSFIGSDGKSLQKGTLIQFAAVHIGVHPELAGAATLPLAILFGSDGSSSAIIPAMERLQGMVSNNH